MPQAAKQLDILELIKTKKVNIFDEIWQAENYDEYLHECCGLTFGEMTLTKDEWELLKGWLENEKKR